MKTADLEGLWLDYWLAKAEGKEPERFDRDGHAWVRCRGDLTPYSAESWHIAGPIIEREGIVVQKWDNGYRAGTHVWATTRYGEEQLQFDGEATGPKYLIAAMRAYLRSKFGDEVGDPP